MQCDRYRIKNKETQHIQEVFCGHKISHHKVVEKAMFYVCAGGLYIRTLSLEERKEKKRKEKKKKLFFLKI
jgi:hypothetical protein